MYDMSDIQRELFYNYLFRINVNSSNDLKIAIKKFAQFYPKFPIENMKSKILADFISKIDAKNEYKALLIEVNNQYANLPEFVADLDKMNSAEASDFWNYLK